MSTFMVSVTSPYCSQLLSSVTEDCKEERCALYMPYRGGFCGSAACWQQLAWEEEAGQKAGSLGWNQTDWACAFPKSENFSHSLRSE